MRRRRWWSRLSGSAAVMAGGVTAAVLIAWLGWGAHGGWRLLAAAASGLTVTAAVFELPVTPVPGEGRDESDDQGGAGRMCGGTKV